MCLLWVCLLVGTVIGIGQILIIVKKVKFNLTTWAFIIVIFISDGFSKVQKGKKANIIDNMMNMLEEYSNHLEGHDLTKSILSGRNSATF